MARRNVHLRQLEDAQDGRRGGRARAASCAAGVAEAPRGGARSPWRRPSPRSTRWPGALEGSSRSSSPPRTCHWEAQGAFTGEISAAMLAEVGCAYGIVGHSERRQLFGETDEAVRKKVGRAPRGGASARSSASARPSPSARRDRTLEVVERQVRGGLAGPRPPSSSARLTVAYEPVWAIGTGKTATPAQAQEVHAAIRELLRELGGELADDRCASSTAAR